MVRFRISEYCTIEGQKVFDLQSGEKRIKYWLKFIPITFVYWSDVHYQVIPKKEGRTPTAGGNFETKEEAIELAEKLKKLYNPIYTEI